MTNNNEFVSVPREPTEEMIRSAHLADPLGCDVEHADTVYPAIWAAMLAAAPSAPVGSGEEWLPIETAPKDGTWIEAYRPKANAGRWNRVEIVRWDQSFNSFVWPSIIFDIFDGDYERLIDDEDFYEDVKNSFTHWRPLPAPPSPNR